MAPSIFHFVSSSSDETNGISLFEIRLNQNPIFLRGHENEAPGALLSGTLVLCLSAPMHIRNVHVTLRGEKQVGWFLHSMSGEVVKEVDHFFRHRWDFRPPARTLGETPEKGNLSRIIGDAIEKRILGETVEKGNYTWNFELEMPGNWSESVEGSLDTYIIYRLKATIDRRLPNIVIQKPLRVIRTPDPSSLDLCQPASVEESWTDKLEYSVSIPTRGVVFGSPIQVNIKIVPLVKGLTIESLTTSLIEFRFLQFARSYRKNRFSRVIARDEWVPSHDMELETIEIDGKYGHRLRRSVQIPTSLTRCLQSVNTRGIEVRHMVQSDLRFRNPDGHRSKISARLVVFIYISPHLAPDDDDTVNSALNANPAITDVLNATVPPQYGAHQLDQLYSDVDSLCCVTPAGYLTPAGYATPAGYVASAGTVALAGNSSGFNTPFTSNSGSTSVDDLVSVSGVPQGWAANILQIRLQPFSVSGDSDQGYFRQFSDRENSMRRGELAGPTVDVPLTAAYLSTGATPLAVAAPSAAATPLTVATPSTVISPPAVAIPSTIAPSLAVANPSAAATPLAAETISAVSMAPIVDTPSADERGSPNETPSTIITPHIASLSAAADAPPTGAVSTTTPTYVVPQYIEYSTAALCKVPSYRTARNTRPPVLIRDGLPNYESAVHAPIVVPVGSQPMPSDPRPTDEPQNPAP